MLKVLAETKIAAIEVCRLLLKDRDCGVSMSRRRNLGLSADRYFRFAFNKPLAHETFGPLDLWIKNLDLRVQRLVDESHLVPSIMSFPIQNFPREQAACEPDEKIFQEA